MRKLLPLLWASTASLCLGQDDWIPRQSPYRHWTLCAALPGRFLVTAEERSTPGDFYTATSPNGVNWTEGSLPEHYGLITGANMFFGYHTDGSFWMSRDGVSVIRSGPPVTDVPDFYVTEAAWGDGVWLTGGTGFIRRSADDGVTWTMAAFPGNPWGLLHHQGEFLAVGAGNVLMASEDGITWRERSRDMAAPFHQNSDTLFSGWRYSTDSGRSWGAFSLRENLPGSICAHPRGFLGRPPGGPGVLSSEDGQRWVKDGAAPQYFNSVCYAGGTAVACGYFGTIASRDFRGGPRLVPEEELTIKPALELSLPAAPGKLHQFQWSPDGLTWTGEGEPFRAAGGTLRFPRPAADTRGFLRVLTK